MSSFHDVTPGPSRLDEARVRSVISQATMLVGNRPPEDAHFDSDGLVAGDGALEAFRADSDRALIAELNRRRWTPGNRVQRMMRADSFGAGVSGFPTDFEFARSQIFSETRVPLSAAAMFPIDSSVPLGARTHSARRGLGQGSARIYRGGNELPRATTTYIREQFGVAYVVCSVEQNFFEALTTDFANLQQYQQDIALAYRLVDERLNRLYWFGDLGSQVYGILNYPSLPTMVVGTAMTDAHTTAECVAALSDFINKPMVTSTGVFAMTALGVSPKLNAFITSPRFTNGAPGLTIKQMLLNNTSITSITMCPELAGIGPSGEDGMLGYRPEPETVALVEIQSTTTMPVYQTGPFDQTTAVFAATGGVTSFATGNMLLGFVTVS